VRLFPVFHPAAALYTPANVDVLRRDFQQLPGLLALGAPEQPPPLVEAPLEPETVVEVAEVAEVAEPRPEPEPGSPPAGPPTLAEELDAAMAPPAEPQPEQLGLF
jgi:DNA polymerase